MKLFLALAFVCMSATAQDRGIPKPKPVPPAPVRGEPVPKPVPPTPAKPAKQPVKQEVNESTAATQPVAPVAPVERNEWFAGVAQVAALVPLTPVSGGSTLNIGAATFGGQSAIGVTFAHRQGATTFSGGAAASNSGRSLVRLSVGWSF